MVVVCGWWWCFFFFSRFVTYHCDRVDRVHDGEQQDVVLGKVPSITHE